MSILKRLLKIHGFKYDWNEQMYSLMGKRGTEYGVIAQEVQKEFPEIVSKGKDGYLEVDHKQFIPIMIESIRELKNEIDNLKHGGL
jgi:hypothetical protein